MADFIGQATQGQKPSSGVNWVEQAIGGLPAPTTLEQSNIEADPQKQGLRQVLPRGQIAIQADTAAEVNDVFRKYYPDGDVRRETPDGPLLYRTVPSEKYRKLDPSIFTDEGRLKDLPYDLVDLVASAPTAAAELILFGITKNPGVLQNTATAMTGGAIGEAVRQGSQTVAGTQREGGEDIASRVGMEALLSGTGEVAAKPAIGAINALRGGANVLLKEGSKQAQRAAKRMGLPAFTPGQISRSPLLRRLEAQSAAISTLFEERIATQKREAMSTLRRLGLQSDPKQAVSRLGVLVGRAEAKIMARFKYNSTPSVVAGENLKKGLLEWDDLKRAQVTAAYDHARQLGGARYDISGLQDMARQIAAGRQGVSAQGDEISLDPDLEKALDDTIGKILSLDPSLPPTASADATDQLAALRSTLWELKTPNPGEISRFSNKRAGDLYRAITDVLKNPVSDDAGVTAAWKEASKLASERFDVWDKTIVATLAKTQTPGKLAATLFGPNKVDDITFLKELLPTSRFQTFKDFSAGRIIENPKLLRSLDRETLEVTFNSAERSLLEGITNDLDILRAGQFRELAAKNFTNRQLIRKFISNVSPAEAQGFIRAVTQNPQAINDVRAALIDEAVGGAIKAGEGGAHKALQKTLDGWRDNGLIQIFDMKQKRSLLGLISYLKKSEQRIDTGTSLVAAGAVGKLKRAPIAALTMILHTVGIGRVLMSDAMQRFMVGTGARAVNLSAVRALMATAVASVQPETPNQEN